LVADPKPPKGWREIGKRAEARQHAELRAACRKIVYDRAEGCCEWCGVPLVLLPSQARHEFQIAHIDEIKKRSQGGSDTDPDNCRCLCYKCHYRRHNQIGADDAEDEGNDRVDRQRGTLEADAIAAQFRMEGDGD
jgi:5-methylcytosine-specific restriction endonuclease McrA